MIVDRPRRLVREGERMLAAPRTRAVAAVVLGCDELAARVERIAEAAPLRGARPRAMQRDHGRGVR